MAQKSYSSWAFRAQYLETAPTDEEVSAGVTITNKEYLPGDVRRYGAVGDGTTDDSTAIQSALDVAGAHPVVFQPATTYRIDTGLTWATSNSIVYGNGAILTTANDIVGLTVGNLGAGNVYYKMKLNGGLYLQNTGTSTKQAFLLQQVYEGEFHISALNWYYGLEMTSSAVGCVYNKIYVDAMISNDYGVYLHPTSNGWVNENNFYGGRFGSGSSTLQWHVYMPDSGTTYGQPNNNKFFGPSFECASTGSMQGFYLDGGIQNYLDNPRVENLGTISDIEIKITSDAINAVVMHPYLTFAGDEAGGAMIEDLGVESLILAIDKFRWSARQNGPASTMIDFYRARANSGQVPVAELRDYYTQSQDAMTYKSSVGRQTTAGYHFKAVYMGSIVTGADGRDYHCISGHTSSATDEPGVGANWATYWELLPSTAANGTAWATSTAYTGESTHFVLSTQGHILTNQATADTNTPSGATAYKLPIYNSSHTLLGYIPIYASAW